LDPGDHFLANSGLINWTVYQRIPRFLRGMSRCPTLRETVANEPGRPAQATWNLAVAKAKLRANPRGNRTGFDGQVSLVRGAERSRRSLAGQEAYGRHRLALPARNRGDKLAWGDPPSPPG